VIARNSSFAYKGKATKESEIGKELGVKYLLEGSVRKAANQIRIGVELVDASSDTERWTQRFDRPLTDIFAVQDEIVGKVVTTLGLIFKLDELNLPGGISFQPTDNLEAYDDFLRGAEYHLRFTKDDDAKARQWVEKAIALDPEFGEAYALLGWIYWNDAWSQWSENPQSDLQRSSELAAKALALDDSNTDALALRCDADWMQRRFDQAVADGERAVAINPNYADGYRALSDALASFAKPEEALRAAEKAIRLNPAAQDYYGYALGNAYVQMGRYQEAITVLKRNLSLYPNNVVAHLAIVIAYAELGQDQDAHAEAAAIMRISPHFAASSLKGLPNVTLHKNWESDWHKAGLK
jgi:adenylate cyclase